MNPFDSRLSALLLGVSLNAVAMDLPTELDLSGDTDWTAGLSLFADDAASRVSLSGAVAGIALGPLPRNADLTAYDSKDNGQRLIALDITVDFGFGPIQPRDVVGWIDLTPSLYFDGSTAGVPAGARIDALGHVRQTGAQATLLSFDVTVLLPGGLVAADEDVVAWDGAAWSMFFDGSANGVPAPFDVDGYDRDPTTGTQYFSFDTSGIIAGVYFDDEDVVAFDGSDWSLVYDASANAEITLAKGDLDALGVRLSRLFMDGFENAPMVE